MNEKNKYWNTIYLLILKIFQIGKILNKKEFSFLISYNLKIFPETF